MTSPLVPPEDAVVLPLPGLEPDNLLAFLALLGLLRALETARKEWRPRASWQGPPFVAQLHLAAPADETSVAQAASEGAVAIASAFALDQARKKDGKERKNVDFDRAEFRDYATRVRTDEIAAALAAAMTAELPEKKNGGLQAAPLVMMFGQGHQDFIRRLVDVPRDIPPSRYKKMNNPPDLRGAKKIAEALFAPWRREDDADGFRWDPEEDQRYALRFGDPSAAGAAPTVHGANRLAAVGFLSFATAPREGRIAAVGAARDDGEWAFVWPIWSAPLSRFGIEALLAHPDLLAGKCERLRPLDVTEIFRARRINNGKFMNVTRAAPVTGRESDEPSAAT